MKAMLRKHVDRLRSSYWFIPSLMALASIGLSIGMVALDRSFGMKLMRELPVIYISQPSGARALLQTIAGSMITVAGVTFSITIATVAGAATAFGPRLMTNFMNDRGNQITLGTFIATFLYSLLVLRTVHSAEDGSSNEIFVPNLAIFVSLALAMASLAVLIYFIHHIPESIHISNMIARSGQQLQDRIDALYPDRVGQQERTVAEETLAEEAGDGDWIDYREAQAALKMFEGVGAVTAVSSGYVQHVEPGPLLRAASGNNVLLCIVGQPGAFVGADVPLVLVKPRDLLTERLVGQIRSSFVVGPLRTPVQDMNFMIDQLVEVAARALSPGINDPFTAMYCMDWLRSGLIKLAGREIPSAFRYDDEGQLRIIALPVSFEQAAEAAFGQLRPYVQSDRNAALHMAETMAHVAHSLPTRHHRHIMRRHVDAFSQGCEGSLSDVADRDAVVHRCRQILDALNART